MDKWNIVISNQERIIELQERSLFTLQEILRAVQPKGITINTEFYPQEGLQFTPQDDKTPIFPQENIAGDNLYPLDKSGHAYCNCEECNGG